MRLRAALALTLLPARSEPLLAALEHCSEAHGASGTAFFDCTISRAGEQAVHTEPEVVRNFSCAADDGGSPILRTMEVTVGDDACDAAPALASSQASEYPDFTYVAGRYLPAGNDLGQKHMSARDAAAHCLLQPECEGFTFKADSERGPATVFFKTTSVGQQRAVGWHTFKRRRPPVCSVREPRTFKVEVVREVPLVVLVRGFATQGECDVLVDAGGNWSSMGRAFTSSGTPSAYRRSYSTNIYPPLHDSSNGLTQITNLMFGLTRRLTGYAVYPPGQEPVNAVLYRDLGDEYRPHCDGNCRGGRHRTGERIATSILYCQTALRGGHTSFSRGALRIAPAEGDMLLFAYRLADGTMSGQEAEHSGCPIRSGRKWIATQWYREGVSEDWTWQEANAKWG